jgi:hypothetical protein
MFLSHDHVLTMAIRSAGFKPFMEYAGSYALFNYRLVEQEKGLDYDNLRLVRAFEHGLDHTSSEAGFVLVHIAMVRESGALVKGACEMLKSCAGKDREQFDEGLRTLVTGLKKVNGVMNSMSLPSHLDCLSANQPYSNVEPLQAIRVHHLQDFHLWYHITVYGASICPTHS